jgi:hypothetical protein
MHDCEAGPTESTRETVALLRARARAVGTLLALAFLFAACRGHEPQARAEAARLQRQIAGLRKMIAAAEKGTLLPPDRLAVGVEAMLVRDLLQRRLPLETAIVAPWRIRIETADIVFEGGESLVTLRGRVHSGDAANYADVLLLGGLQRFEVDAYSGMLTAHVELDRVEVERLEAGAVERSVALGVASALGGRGLSTLGDVLPSIEIPVRLEHAIDFRGVADGTVSLPPKRLPMHVFVDRAFPVAGRLWILLDVTTR